MSSQSDSTPSDKPEQVARAKRLREAMARIGREPVPESPRSVTDRAAAEAARKAREEQSKRRR